MSEIGEMSDAEAKEKQQDFGLLRQAAERIGRPLLEELAEVDGFTEADAEKVAGALVRTVNAGWNLACQRRELEIEQRDNPNTESEL